MTKRTHKEEKMKLAKILFVIWPVSWAIAFVCEITADRLIEVPRWRKSRLISAMLDTTRALVLVGIVCLIGGIFSFLSSRTSPIRRTKR